GLIPLSYRGPSLARALGVDELAARAAREITRDVGDALLEAIKANTPVRTGRLRDSWRLTSVRRRGSGYRIVAETSVDYAPDVEYDTRPHLERPDERKALRFEVDGREVFARAVFHPGTHGAHSTLKATVDVDARLHQLAEPALERFRREFEARARSVPRQ